MDYAKLVSTMSHPWAEKVHKESGWHILIDGEGRGLDASGDGGFDAEIAKQIASTSGMMMALELIARGMAYIERAGNVTVFHFQGRSYLLKDTWTGLMHEIGWEACCRALNEHEFITSGDTCHWRLYLVHDQDSHSSLSAEGVEGRDPIEAFTNLAEKICTGQHKIPFSSDSISDLTTARAVLIDQVDPDGGVGFAGKSFSIELKNGKIADSLEIVND